MRQIKFRGKDSDGNWHYGSLIQYKSGEVAIANFERYGNECSTMSRINVDPATVGQFTGLCDKHGKEVYEGDIVRLRVSDNRYKRNPRYTTKTIRYDNRLARFEADGIYWINLSSDRIEVLGNINDNSKLLKGGEI